MRKSMIMLAILLLVFTGCQSLGLGRQENATQNITLPLRMTGDVCRSGGGFWNGADACKERCLAECMCGGVQGYRCPDGFHCTRSGSKITAMAPCVLD